jgi:hypothetical protein
VLAALESAAALPERTGAVPLARAAG